jgi:hypothetical protein
MLIRGRPRAVAEPRSQSNRRKTSLVVAIAMKHLLRVRPFP